MNKAFMFDTICDDIIGEILQYIKWCKALDRSKGEKDPYRIKYHRLLWIDRPIITYTYLKWRDVWKCNGELDSCDLRYKTRSQIWQDYLADQSRDQMPLNSEILLKKLKEKPKRTIKKDTKGLISYTYERGKFKEIAM